MTPPEAIMGRPAELCRGERMAICDAILSKDPSGLDEIREAIENKSIFSDTGFEVDFSKFMEQVTAIGELVQAYRHFGMEDKAQALLTEYELSDPQSEQPADTKSAEK